MTYRDLTSFNNNCFELINFDYNFILERSQTPDSRPFTTPKIISEPSFNDNNPNIIQHDIGQNNLHFNQDETTELFQNQEPQQFDILPDPQQVTSTLQNVPDPSETATIHSVSVLYLIKLFDITMDNPQSLTRTNGSNKLQIPVHNITQYPITDPNQNDTTHNTNQDNTSTISISNTHQ